MFKTQQIFSQADKNTRFACSSAANSILTWDKNTTFQNKKNYLFDVWHELRVSSGGKWELQLPLALADPSSFVLCSLYTNLMAERKWRMLQVLMGSRVTVCEIVDAAASFKSGVWKHFGQEMRKQKTENRKQSTGLEHTHTALYATEGNIQNCLIITNCTFSKCSSH